MVNKSTATAPTRNGVSRRIASTKHTLKNQAEAGLATAEYAIATVAAAGFAGLLLLILRSGEVRGMLNALVQNALSLS